ncbi:hypothetical protein J2125_002607 [Erwinia toletana]|uniref:Fe2OG dioxygenase domain-containing protein n=1 Tax=Winslowiella toletana TaxID=92490 RepID=A0ABS4P9U6_9GAMM|nr:2OG-Fe(II) oxygenase family protein [Winslowiella toletana]MBP2169415.1 hypothetical protein [Winslowiella toletana]
MSSLATTLNLLSHPISDKQYIAGCKRQLDQSGALVLRDFLTAEALQSIKQEGDANSHRAFYASNSHNVYLSQPDSSLPADHARNRQVVSSKGCITDEEIPADSPLRALYNAGLFKQFLCGVLGEQQLYPYADSLSSINLHYAHNGQELGWHFDNSSFAITLLIQKPQDGGVFEYVSNLRDADRGEMNFAGVQQVLEGERTPEKLVIAPGDLVLFRGRNALHRVTPTEGDTTRMLVVLAYNARPDIALSETARMTFYGRL